MHESWGDDCSLFHLFSGKGMLRIQPYGPFVYIACTCMYIYIYIHRYVMNHKNERCTGYMMGMKKKLVMFFFSSCGFTSTHGFFLSGASLRSNALDRGSCPKKVCSSGIYYDYPLGHYH